ncbi:hypothetical protein [Methylocystis bryophila]|uniref:Uncharacterized protein n=1 Tax=Methylocystis bryophila TaxID=655015 RepID=A0A1W6MWR9_9HYPH|nr:hypothetical protein [Methylocystis bryophila]ARN81976.1 hypothetical protein B1812_13780 [Methylocystis bryophila]BDV38075.1 hypothetical protein DSM21852_13280 [Methylocystis bryophila]
MSIHLSAAIESSHHGVAAQFVIGQDPKGHWIVAESRKRFGGMFATREAALKYAAVEWGLDPQRVRWSNEPLGLWT